MYTFIDIFQKFPKWVLIRFQKICIKLVPSKCELINEMEVANFNQDTTKNFKAERISKYNFIFILCSRLHLQHGQVIINV